jgi:hypothetical protein
MNGFGKKQTKQFSRGKETAIKGTRKHLVFGKKPTLFMETHKRPNRGETF